MTGFAGTGGEIREVMLATLTGGSHENQPCTKADIQMTFLKTPLPVMSFRCQRHPLLGEKASFQGARLSEQSLSEAPGERTMRSFAFGSIVACLSLSRSFPPVPICRLNATGVNSQENADKFGADPSYHRGGRRRRGRSVSTFFHDGTVLVSERTETEQRWANTPRRRSGSIAKLRNQSDLACLFLAMQELDLCIADCKLGFVWLDESQEMQLA
jgi:hypothetical protein